MSLRRRLASHGFESNDDYEFALRLLFEAPPSGVRCLDVAGESGRRKTALAHALAAALDFEHVLYHDFTRKDEAAPTLIVDAETGETQTAESAASTFDRVITEACAYSEGARVVLILDQIQASDFRDQIALYQFAQSREWAGVVGTVIANPATLLLVLISEEPLYHSLQKISFRVWADATGGALDFDPRDHGLGAEAHALFVSLGNLFRQIGQAPTATEFRHILGDLLHRVRSVDQLRTSLFGWIENLDRERIHAAALKPAFEQVIQELDRLIGVEQVDIDTQAPQHPSTPEAQAQIGSAASGRESATPPARSGRADRAGDD